MSHHVTSHLPHRKKRERATDDLEVVPGSSRLRTRGWHAVAAAAPLTASIYALGRMRAARAAMHVALLAALLSHSITPPG